MERERERRGRDRYGKGTRKDGLYLLFLPMYVFCLFPCVFSIAIKPNPSQQFERHRERVIAFTF